jgi:hypothetical protein
MAALLEGSTLGRSDSAIEWWEFILIMPTVVPLFVLG